MVRMICALFVVALSVSIVAAEKPNVKPVAAPADVAKAEAKMMECEFVKFEDGKLTVKVKGSEKSFSCTEKCKCMSPKGEEMKCADLKKGANLKIWVDEKNNVTKIECAKK